MKICMIGCGNHSNSVYAPSLIRLKKENPDYIYSAVCDLDAEKSASYKKLVGFDKTYADYNEMLSVEKPDAVVLVSPYQLTARLGADIARKGYNVMMEKPIGDSVEECLSVVKASEDGGKQAQAAFNRRHIPIVRELAKELKNSPPVSHIDYKMYRTNRREDFFHSTAVHGIDLVGWLAGAAYGSVRFDYYGLDIHMQCKFENGPTAQLSFCPATGLVIERLEIICDNVSYYARLPMWKGPDFPGALIKYESGKLIYEKSGEEISDGPEMNEANGFYAQLNYFFDAVKNGRRTEHGVSTAADTMRVTDCVKRRDAAYIKN